MEGGLWSQLYGEWERAGEGKGEAESSLPAAVRDDDTLNQLLRIFEARSRA